MRFRCAITVLSLLIAVLESRRNPSDQQEPVAVLQLQRSQNTNFRSTNTFAYVWYLANRDEDIACGILVAAAAVSAHGLRNSTDLVVIHNAGVPRPERFRKAGIKLVEVPSAVSKGEVTWRESFMKLRASQLFQYDRVIYFDVDTLPLGSLDNLFNIANFPIEIAAPRAYWLEDVQPFVQSGGPMIIDPRRLFYERDFSKSLDASVVQVDGEMDWVNSHFRNSMDVLDGFYALLVGEWCGDDKIFQYWQKYFQKGPEWILAHAPIVHFIAEWKPWRLTTPEQLQRKCPSAQPQLLQVFESWWKAKARVC